MPPEDAFCKILAVKDGSEVEPRAGRTGTAGAREGGSDAVRPPPTRACTTPVLCGRQADLRFVRKLLLRTRCGRGGSVLFEGPPGIGTTRMLSAAVAEAKQQGLRVARLAIADTGADSFSGMHSLASQLIGSMPALAEEIAPGQRAVLARILPKIHTGLGARYDTARFPSEASGTAQVERRELLDAVLALIRAAGPHRPLLLAVDDLELADEPTFALVSALLDGLRGHHVALAMTAHSEDSTSPQEPWMRVVSPVTRRRLAELGEDDHRAMLLSAWGPLVNLDAPAAYLYRVSGGVPGASMLVAQQLFDRCSVGPRSDLWPPDQTWSGATLPQSVDEAVEARMSSLPRSALQLAMAIAAAPRQQVHFEALGSLLEGEGAAAALVAVDALLAADMVTSDGLYYRLKHRVLHRPLLSYAERTAAQQG